MYVKMYVLKYFKALKRKEIVTYLKLAKKRATCQTYENITEDIFPLKP